MKNRERLYDFQKAKSRLAAILKKTSQGKYDNQAFVRDITKLKAITHCESGKIDSPIWNQFLSDLRSESILITKRFDEGSLEILDEMPESGSARQRLANVCKGLLSNFNQRFEMRHGSRASEAFKAGSRKGWLLQVIQTFAQEARLQSRTPLTRLGKKVPLSILSAICTTHGSVAGVVGN